MDLDNKCIIIHTIELHGGADQFLMNGWMGGIISGFTVKIINALKHDMW